jgi:hypothetical protein
MLQGAAGPAQYVMIGALARDWAPTASAGAYLMLLSSHFQANPLFPKPQSLLHVSTALLNPHIFSLFFSLGNEESLERKLCLYSKEKSEMRMKREA